MILIDQRKRTPNSRPRSTRPLSRRPEIIEARAAFRLRQSPYADIRRVTCAFHEGMLSLRGRVRSYYLKQIAQTVVLEMEGVDEIRNQLEVIAPPDRS
jgi:osmotically-inducible protein OsmY